MDIGMIGLGKMGGNMTERLIRNGHGVVAYDRSADAVQAAVADGARGANSLESLVSQLAAPRAIWLMIPAGVPTQSTIEALVPLLQRNDIIVDGGNSFYGDSLARAALLEPHGIHFIDCGTSGGIWGLTEGYCLMVGGDAAAVKRVEPAFMALAPEGGYAHVGPVGAGHFSKMVHNGIEYGLMQAYAEGFEILQSKTEFGYDLHQLSALWMHGSVVRSWLLELAERMFADAASFSTVKGYVQDSGEGRWTVQAAIDQAVPAPVITAALMQRFASRQDESFAARVVAGLRNQFGGHAVVRKDE